MGERIYHLSLVADWSAAVDSADGTYRMSTLGRTLEQEGFIHFSRAGEQLAFVAEQFYADVSEPLCLLEVDTALLPVPIVDEAPAPGSDQRFPHLYAPLPVAAVVDVVPMTRNGDGVLVPAL